MKRWARRPSKPHARNCQKRVDPRKEADFHPHQQSSGPRRSIVRNTCRTPGPVERSGTFDLLTTPTRLQRRALELIDTITA